MTAAHAGRVRFNGIRDARVLGEDYVSTLRPGDRLDTTCWTRSSMPLGKNVGRRARRE
jgi:hypothetical protein